MAREQSRQTSAYNFGYLRLPCSSAKEPILGQKLSTCQHNVECLYPGCNPQSLKTCGRKPYKEIKFDKIWGTNMSSFKLDKEIKFDKIWG